MWKTQKELKRLNLLRCNKCKKIKSIEKFPKANTCTYLCADYLKEYYKNWYNENGRNRNKKSVKAGTILNKAIREGKIQRLTYCQICPKIGGKISGHHYDYDKPLEAIWACPSCHRRIHSNHLEIISDIEILKSKLNGGHNGLCG